MRLDRARLSPAARRSLEAAEAAPKGGPPRPSPLSPWQVFAASVREWIGVAPALRCVTIHLPGLQLLSENVALRGGKGKSRIAVACEAKRQAREALMKVPVRDFSRFEGLCEITIVQSSEKPRIDAPNLFHKALIDCLTARSGGLGIIPDDSPKYLNSYRVAYRPNSSEEDAVACVVEKPYWERMTD